MVESLISTDNKGYKMKTDKDKIKKIIKYIIGFLAASSLCLYLLFVKVQKMTNYGGVQMVNNNGTINYYDKVQSDPLKKDDEDISYNTDYTKTFVNQDESMINSKTSLEGILTKFKYSMDLVGFTTYFKNNKAYVTFGPDQVGFKLSVGFEDGEGNSINMSVPDDIAFLVYGEDGDIKEDLDVQISVYDFDNDGVNELIVFMRSEIGGVCSVFSYTDVSNKTKVNPLNQELCVEAQRMIAVDGNKLIVPIGSQGLFNLYKYDEGIFYQIQ